MRLFRPPEVQYVRKFIKPDTDMVPFRFIHQIYAYYSLPGHFQDLKHQIQVPLQTCGISYQNGHRGLAKAYKILAISSSGELPSRITSGEIYRKKLLPLCVFCRKRWQTSFPASFRCAALICQAVK